MEAKCSSSVVRTKTPQYYLYDTNGQVITNNYNTSYPLRQGRLLSEINHEIGPDTNMCSCVSSKYWLLLLDNQNEISSDNEKVSQVTGGLRVLRAEEWPIKPASFLILHVLFKRVGRQHFISRWILFINQLLDLSSAVFNVCVDRDIASCCQQTISRLFISR